MPAMTYAPPPPPPGLPPGPPAKSNTGMIIGIVVAIVLLICLACSGAFIYFGWWATNKAEDIVENLPTGFPTEDEEESMRIILDGRLFTTPRH